MSRLRIAVARVVGRLLGPDAATPAWPRRSTSTRSPRRTRPAASRRRGASGGPPRLRRRRPHGRNVSRPGRPALARRLGATWSPPCVRLAGEPRLRRRHRRRASASAARWPSPARSPPSAWPRRPSRTRPRSWPSAPSMRRAGAPTCPGPTISSGAIGRGVRTAGGLRRRLAGDQRRGERRRTRHGHLRHGQHVRPAGRRPRAWPRLRRWLTTGPAPRRWRSSVPTCGSGASAAARTSSAGSSPSTAWPRRSSASWRLTSPSRCTPRCGCRWRSVPDSPPWAANAARPASSGG